MTQKDSGRAQRRPRMTRNKRHIPFDQRFGSWLAHYDAALADLTARVEAHKARTAESGARVDAFLQLVEVKHG